MDAPRSRVRERIDRYNPDDARTGRKPIGKMGNDLS